MRLLIGFIESLGGTVEGEDFFYESGGMKDPTLAGGLIPIYIRVNGDIDMSIVGRRKR